MHLKSAKIVKEDIGQVTKFFYDPASLAKWDRSVAKVIPGSSGSSIEEATFDTIAPSGMKMSYRVIEFSSYRSVKILLTNSKMFKKAIWHFQFDPADKGTKITCHIHFTLRALYLFLYPVLYFSKHALLRDLNYFEAALNEHSNK